MILIAQLRIPCGQGEAGLNRKLNALMEKARVPKNASVEIAKHSIDARKRPELYDVYSVVVDPKVAEAEEDKIIRRIAAVNRKLQCSCYDPKEYHFPEPGQEKLRGRPVVIGAGPAGLFCALLLAEHGYQPLLLERGRAMEERTEDVERFWRTGELNPESNCQFGEGGAGTFSDGKLTTLVNDPAGRTQEIYRRFIAAGAPDCIRYEGKPHIGTDLLKTVIVEIRNKILRLGGEVRFGARVSELILEKGRISGVIVNNTERIDSDVVVLAPGHSARDTIRMLYDSNVKLEQKQFALGFRVIHPQELIDSSQYGISDTDGREKLHLPAASYKLTAKAESGRGVYSFCMCPGGYVVNASSEAGRLAVNGMSNFARDSGFANSAIVMTVGEKDFGSDQPLAGMVFQEKLEEKCYRLGGGNIPVQSFRDFADKCQPEENSSCYQDTERCIKGRAVPAALHTLLPEDLTEDFTFGMEQFGRMIHGYSGDKALIAGLESRTSSPVRIPRTASYEAENIPGLYPCGEGAGYAGGIMSAAMDGMKIAEAIGAKYCPPKP